MIEWKGKYKCRLCGKIFVTCMTATESVAKKSVFGLVIGEKLEVQQPEEKTIHFCENGSFGVADFIGMEKDIDNV